MAGINWDEKVGSPVAIEPDGSAVAAPPADSVWDRPATAEETALVSDPGFWDYAKDAWLSLGRGLDENVASYPGVLGDVEQLAGAANIVGRKYGVSPPDEAELQRLRQENERGRRFPTTEEMVPRVNPVAEPYKSRTGVGQVVGDVASMVGPGLLRNIVRHLGRDVVLPYMGAKAGDIAAEKAGLGPEEQQLLSAAGGMAGGPGYEGAKRVATRTLRGPLTPEAATTMQTLQPGAPPMPLTPEGPNARAERIRRLQAEGVEATGGQATGSEGLKYAEVGPFANKAAGIKDQQARQITRAVLKRVGINADVASPEVMAAAQKQFGQMYEALIRQNNGVKGDVDLNNGLTDIAVNTERLLRTPENIVTEYYNDIANTLQTYGNVIPPDVYQKLHSDISADIRKLGTDPARGVEVDALGEIQDALYDTIGRNGQPEVQAAAQQLNNRYRNFKIVQKSVGGAGEGVSFGLVSPEKLRAELERRDPAAYSQGRGDFARLVRDTQSLSPLPNSGTGGRLAASGLTGLAAAIPAFAQSALLTSRPVRTSIVSRAVGDHPDAFNYMQAPPILNQAMQAGEDDGVMPLPIDMSPIAIEPEQEQPVPVDESALNPKLVDPRDILRRRGLNFG